MPSGQGVHTHGRRAIDAKVGIGENRTPMIRWNEFGFGSIAGGMAGGMRGIIEAGWDARADRRGKRVTDGRFWLPNAAGRRIVSGE